MLERDPGRTLRRAAAVLAGLAALPPLGVLLRGSAGTAWAGPLGPGLAQGSAAVAWIQLCLAAGVLAWSLARPRRRGRNLASLLAILALLLGLAHLGIRLLRPPIGPHTPFALGAQAVAGLALLALGLRRGRQAAAILGLLPLGVGTLVLLGAGAGAPLLDQASPLVLSLPCALGLVWLGSALVAASGPRAWPLAAFRLRHRRPGAPAHPRGPLLIFAGLVGLLVLGGGLYLRGQLARARRTAEAELRAVADLKASQISEWYRIRVSVAEQAFHSPLLHPLLLRALARPDDVETRALVQSWMESQQRIHGFQGIALLDRQARALLAVPAEGAFGVPPGGRFQAALARREVTVADLHRDPGGGDVHLGLSVPVRPEPQAPALGLLYFHLSGADHLFPLVQSWPVPSATAETELLRAEDGDLVFLNDLRHRSASALDLRLPLAGHRERVGALAVAGHRGLLEGPDYRGTPVLAAARRVAGTPWFLVAKVDEAEVYGPVRRQLWITGALLLGLILAAGFGLGLLLREREAENLRARLALQRDQARLAARYEQLMRQANDALLVMDARGRILEANAQAESQYGYTASEFRGLEARDLLASGAPAELEPGWEGFQPEGGLRFETRHRRKDGTTFPVEVVRSRVAVADEALVLSVVRDASERKAQEAQLARMNRLYAALSQVNQGIVWAQDEADLLARIPRVLQAFGGFAMAWIGRVEPGTHRIQVVGSAGDATGLLDRIVVRDDDSPEGLGAVGRALRSGEPCLFDDFLSLPASDPWKAELARAGLASLAAFPLRRGGRMWGALAVYAAELGFFGPQEMELLAEAAMDLSFALDHLDADSEHRRIEARLNEVEKLESVGSLAAGVAHDMNNVLTAILTLTTLHREGQPPDSPLGRALDTMSRACLRGRDLVAGLLSFARRELEQEGPVHLRALVEEAVQLLSRTTLQRIRFDLDLAPDLPPLRADATALHRTLMNLCVNAVDAMPHGGTITLATRRTPMGGQELRVRDTGEGMSEEVARRALEPFYTTKPRGKGTGLGLSMAYGTLKAHGGDLEIHSRPGAGTEIVLRFPPERVCAGAGVEPAGEPAGGGRPRGVRILLVDDDDLVREAVVPMLQSLGHAVDTASGGLEALRRIESGLEVDLVILDMNMPGLTGAEVLPRLLALRPGLPVLMASGHAEAGLAALLAPYPRVATLAKPFTLEEVLEKLRTLLAA